MDLVDVKFVEAYRAGHAIQAHAIKHALEDAGISVMIEGEALQGAIGDVPAGWSSAPRLMVPESQLEAAFEVIRQTDHSNEAEGHLSLNETAAVGVAAMLGWVGIGLIADADSTSEQTSQTETTRCLACDAVMAELESACPSCGWTYESDALLEPLPDCD